MDILIETVIDILGELLEFALGRIPNPKKRKWALTVFYSTILLALTAFLIYLTISVGQEGNRLGATVIGLIAAAIFLGFGFFVVRGHKQSWKKRQD